MGRKKVERIKKIINFNQKICQKSTYTYTCIATITVKLNILWSQIFAI